MENKQYTLGIDIGSTTVKIAILDSAHNILFSDYKRHFANIRETLHSLLSDAYSQLGNIRLHPMITGSGGLTLANHLKVPFCPGGNFGCHCIKGNCTENGCCDRIRW